ncbi:Poly(A) polymerase [Phytophthora palmivora]|uniref:Poly(A) polymerase n=1 Tax=Phytophthora palmivora TaxID=4796 RepID=A0A2P4Y081_9STRA|nr:Poly(A) polymerase [Phytophthora palmivora]
MSKVLSNAESKGSIGDYRDAQWFKAGEGDLVFAQWLLGRCNGVGDATTPQSEAATKRMFALFKTQRKLRRELALGSKREVTSAEETEDEAEDEHVDSEEPLWPVEQIVEEVGNVLRPSRRELMKQQREAETNNSKIDGAFERIVVAEVVDNATELILSRGTSEHEELLRRWVEILKEEEMVDEEKAEDQKENVPEESPEVDGAAIQKTKKRDKKMRMKKNKSKMAEETACEQVESFLTFLNESAKIHTQAEVSVTIAPSEAEKVWNSELQRIVEISSIEPEEEARRLLVARDIQTVLRREVSKWRHCEVILFGSSLTHYGSTSSDLDMCLLPNGRTVGKIAPTKEVVGKRQLQQLIDGKISDNRVAPTTDAEIAEQLRDLRGQIQKSIEKLTQALNTLDRSGKKGDKQIKQRRQLEFFDTQMRLLRNAIMDNLTQLIGVTEPSNGASANGRPAHLKTIIAASRRRSDDLYLLRAILQRAAKCEVVRVLPNLQDPQLLEYAHVEPDYYNDINIAFCEDRDIAQAYHRRTSGGGLSDMSLTTLLLGFFEFYATQFDFAKRVVTVRSPATPALKLAQWGSRKAKTWRISIQDPLETGRDLGCVLQFKGQEKIISEVRRAYEMLAQGDSFSDEVCIIDKPARKLGKTGGKAKQQTDGNASQERSKTTQQPTDKMKRSYSMILQSADEELTKETIETLFKDFHRSFRVGNVVEAPTPKIEANCDDIANKNKRSTRCHTNGKLSDKGPYGDKKTESERVVVSTVQRVEMVEFVTSGVEGEGANANKSNTKKKKWQQRVHRKRGNPKRENNTTAE